jgi:2-phosphoglycerate kinase
MTSLRERLSHVLWIGGGTDSGKTSVAALLSKQYSWPVYHYDQADLRHHKRLAETSEEVAAFLAQSMDERWVKPEPIVSADRAWQAFNDRFPLVLDDLTALSLPEGMKVIAEGFGLTPELVEPFLVHPNQAVWLVPSVEFKQMSMRRRRKGEFGGEVSDPARAAANLFERDMILTDRIVRDARVRRLGLIEVDVSKTVKAVAAQVMDHFSLSIG